MNGRRPEDPEQRPTGRTGGLAQVTGAEFDAWSAVGGVRGIVEAVAPGMVFIVAFLLTGQLVVPLVAALSVAGLATVLRLVQGTPVTQAIGGLLGVGVGVLMAWRSGQAQDFYLWGLLVNAAYVIVLLPALALRWPVVGVVVALLRGQDMGWRTDPARRPARQAYTWATWAWIALFLSRLLVQVPLYLAGEVAWLGVARLVMGVPLWAACLWLTWLLVRHVDTPEEDEVTRSAGTTGAQDPPQS